ncbi:hypothetical protein [Massilia sp. TN1-12]|uniref:hypothetical protein n=1 Tax=Massilia paldalensis TaxID=3377675 RepID=UPI0038501C8B
MRPTDENQPGSRRPNLMSSSRRANGEISILAMLDGQSRRSLARRFPRMPALLAYAAAGTAACTLVGVLAWLAHDGMDRSAGKDTDGNTMTVAQAPSTPASTDAEAATQAAAPDEALSRAPAPATADVDAPLPTGTAAIVDALNTDMPPPDTPTAADALPAPAAPAARPLPTVASVPASPSALAAGADTGKAGAMAATPPTRSHGPKGAAVRPLAVVRPVQAPVRTGTPLKPKRNAAPTKLAAPAVDMDVALITAIIQHAGRPLDATGAEHADATCAGKPCGPRMPEQP